MIPSLFLADSKMRIVMPKHSFPWHPLAARYYPYKTGMWAEPAGNPIWCFLMLLARIGPVSAMALLLFRVATPYIRWGHSFKEENLWDPVTMRKSWEAFGKLPVLRESAYKQPINNIHKIHSPINLSGIPANQIPKFNIKPEMFGAARLPQSRLDSDVNHAGCGQHISKPFDCWSLRSMIH